MGIDDVVKVDITRATGAVSKAGFGTILAMTAHYRTANRFDLYGDTDAMLTAGWLEADLGFKAAQAIKRASPTPSQFAMGRRQVETVEITVTDAINATDYIISINGTPYTYNATVPTDDEDAIATALAALVNADANVSAAAVGAVITVTDVLGDWVLSTATSVGGLSEGTITATETVTAARAAISAENNDYYGVGLVSRVIAEQLALAADLETVRKIFVTSENTAAAVDTAPASDTTSLMAQEKALGHARTMVLYHSASDGTATDLWPEFTWMGQLLTVDPDVETATWNFWTLPGVTVDNLTDAQVNNVVGDQQAGTGGKNGNVYIEIGGSGTTQNGKVAVGEWMDIITGIDWLQARLQENIFRVVKLAKKIPFTNKGISVEEAEVRKMMETGITTDLLARDLAKYGTPGYLVTVPDISQVPANDKAIRVLKNVKFDASVAGAIHATAISGQVSV